MSKMTIQILIFPGDSIFDQSSTHDSRQWRKAICYLTELPICSRIFWGRHFEDQSQVTFLIGWNWDAQEFLTKYYADFAVLLALLLVRPPGIPYAADLNDMVAESAVYPVRGGLTTLSKLIYNSLSDFHRFHLLTHTFTQYHQILAAASMEGDERAEGYRDGTAAWSMDGATGMRSSTLWTMVSWQSLEHEDRCEKTFKEDDGTITKELCLRERMLDLADEEEELHVAWNILIPEVVKKWKESGDEVWKYLYGRC